jgi:Tol biopolymer transport system component
VPRLIPALVGLAALVTAVPAASQVGSGRIAYAREEAGIYALAPDGSPPVLLKSGFFREPRWSPDGSRMAFVGYTGQYELHVMNADGTGDHIIATDANVISLSRQPWSGDGTRVAWGPGGPEPCCPARDGDIYTASAAGGDVRRLTTDGRRKLPPVWSPTSSQLVYASEVPGSTELFLVRGGSAPVQITSGGFQNTQPTWSPDGSSIAFVRPVNSSPAIYTAHPDGSELHRVIGFVGNGAGEPVWSPDGSKIAYTNAVNGRYAKASSPGQEIFLVNADGSGEQRLTELAPQFAADTAPTWSPDGDQILFKRNEFIASLMTMNPDGTCESALGAGDPRSMPSSFESPSWQAVPGGPSVGPKSCRAVAIEPWAPRAGDRSATLVGGTVSNEGTEPLTNVVVTISPSRSDFSLEALEGYECARSGVAFVCRIDRIGRGESRNVAVLGRARRVGRGREPRNKIVTVSARLTMSADGPLLATSRQTGYVLFTPERCTTRDRGGGYIEGTRFPDRICGRRGADDIDPGGGKDYVYAGAGPDVINSGDRYGDVISCGHGRDHVFADRKDRVSRDCERVRRN